MSRSDMHRQLTPRVRRVQADRSKRLGNMKGGVDRVKEHAFFGEVSRGETVCKSAWEQADSDSGGKC